MSERIKLTVWLPADTIERISVLASMYEANRTEALRRSVDGWSYLVGKVQSGSTLFMRQPDGELKEVAFVGLRVSGEAQKERDDG